jgi:hypothetical protein
MSLDVASLGLDQLSVGERLELIEIIWDSLPDSVSPDEVPLEHLAVLQMRRAMAQTQPGIGKPWRQVLDELDNKS